MFDVSMVRSLSDLSKSKILDIMKNYNLLKEKYLKIARDKKVSSKLEDKK